MKYYHVDVFSKKKFSGNGLTIFEINEEFDKKSMHILTQEMKQFESIFYYKINPNTFRAYIFTVEEELDFAGHPIIGLSAMLHDLYSPEKERNSWTIELNEKPVVVETTKKTNYYSARMNQGIPEFKTVLRKEQENEFLSYLNLSMEDKFEEFPFQVVSTGLPYLIVPVKASALGKSKIIIPDLEVKLNEIGAKFIFVLDVAGKQGRTWDNQGWVEDVATGSSAGPVGAYLVENKIAEINSEIIIEQGHFLGRPSQIKVMVTGENEQMDHVFVEGDVCKIAQGEVFI
ncbi:PhzF family phenazine biosynthesis protein [Chryseobacterium sp. LAM-KRS1]|uniref:PhzF family phenazine biosynthesis protein n=1 Tax=Chryseobacterium sp. LAM-KRS1 TaxID=2715754 RepID=UPI0015546AE7|nr:PhzF family phenazine biosynthesis protein [Chryseobacterium sp. LAM-KRS1]